MHMRVGLSVVSIAVAVTIAAPAGPAAATAAPDATDAAAKPLLRLNGIGPLKLGMTRAAAVKTGWLARRGTGCPLGGPPLPITYRVRGAKVPSGVRGMAEFVRGRLRNLSFTRGVRTATGVVVGQTTVTGMVAAYHRAGFRASARFEETFQGTFVTVRRRAGGRQVIGAFGEGLVVQILAIRRVQVCE